MKRAIWVAWAALALSLAAAPLRVADPAPAADPAPVGKRLAPGQAARAAVASGAPAVFVVAAEAGHPWVAVVGEGGVDLALSAAGGGPAAGASGLTRVESPVSRFGVLRLLVEPSAAGEVRIEVTLAAAWSPPVEVTLEVLDLAGASPGRLAAERAEARAAAAVAAGGAEGWSAAEAAYAEAASRWLELARHAEAAQAHHARSAVLRLAGGAADALEAAERAAELYRAAGDRQGEGAATNLAGLALDRIGDVAAARRSFVAARDLLAAHGQPAAAAGAQYNVCLAELRSGAIEAGLACTEEAAAGFEAGGDQFSLATALTTAGRAYDVLAEPEGAFARYEEALAVWRRIENRAGEAKALNNLGFLHAGVGEPQRALAAYEQALAVFRDTGDRVWEARVLHNLGSAYLALGDLRRARALLEEALALRRETQSPANEAQTLSVLGRTLHAAGDYAAAEGFQRQAVALHGELGDAPGQAMALRGLARTLRDAGDLAAAHAALDATAAAIDLAEHPREAGRLLVERGLTRLAAGDAEAAAGDLAAAVRHKRAERDPVGEAEARAGLAAAERRRGRLREAEEHLAASVHRIEESRRRVPGAELRASFLGRWRAVYEEWIDVLMTLHAAEPGAGFDRRALAVSERARARSLLDLLAGVDAALDRRLDPALRERRRLLRRRVAAKAEHLQAAVAKGEPAAIAPAERQLYEAVAALETLEAEVLLADPALAALEAPPTADAAAVAAAVAADELLVEVALGEERSFLWTVGRGGVESFVLPGRAEIEAAARRLHEAASTAGGAGSPDARAAADALAGWLLPPGRVPAEVRRLLLVPDGALHYVPFALLPVAPEGPGGPPVPLVARFEIVTLPSASTALGARPARPAAAGRLAALADPVFDPRDHRVGAAGRGAPAVAAGGGEAEVADDREATITRGGGGDPLALPRLRQSRREVETIAALVPAEAALVATDFAADRELVLSGELAGYAVLHFATHGIFDDSHPELSGLVLSQVDAAGRPKDGFVRLRDIYGLDLDARLVVLSGCRTALGREVRGEGLVGLTRGFMYAGVEQVLASLWRVDDRATADLMERFYRALWIDGLEPAAALARAQRQLALDPRWSDPTFWSAFVLQGTSRRPAGSAAEGGAPGPPVAGRAEDEPPKEVNGCSVVRTTKAATR
jgi:CHAT domain-containing protein